MPRIARPLTELQESFKEQLVAGNSPPRAAKLAGYSDYTHAVDDLLSSRAVVDAYIEAMRPLSVRWATLKEAAKRVLLIGLDQPGIEYKDRLRAAEAVLRALSKRDGGALLADAAEKEDEQEDRLAAARRLLGKIDTKEC